MTETLTLACALLLAPSPLFAAAANPDPASGQRSIEWIERMPNRPQPYVMRDWQKVARDLDALLFDSAAAGRSLPLIRPTVEKGSAAGRSFGFGSYVGADGAQNGVIATLNGKLAGIDKRRQAGRDYLAEVRPYYSEALRLYGVAPGMKAREKFKNTTHFNLGFFQLYDDHRDVPGFPGQFAAVAARWHEALAHGMGGAARGWADFWHWGFDFGKGRLYDDKEAAWADCAGGVAYLQYMAWRELGDARYLDGVDWCVRFLERLQPSPFFEWDMAYGPYVAVRRSAEIGDRRYDVHKLVTWCFEPDPQGARREWGMQTGDWPNAIVQADGLLGGPPDLDKRFLSATANTAINMKGLVRYDDRYARSIGKWLLHAANSARLWYANSLPAAHQHPADKAWADQHDANYVLAYEQVQKYKLLMQFPDQEQNRQGTVTGDFTRLLGEDEGPDGCEILATAPAGSNIGALEHVWRIPADRATSRSVIMRARASGGSFDVFYAVGSPDNWTRAFAFGGGEMQTRKLPVAAGEAVTVYVKAASAPPAAEDAANGQLAVDWLCVQTTDLNISPYLTGPWRSNRMPRGADAREVRNFALYMSVELGRLAAGFGTTDVAEILSWDLNAADFFKGPCYPTHLYYNPHAETKTIHVGAGEVPVDLYDTVSEAFVARGATGVTPISIPPDTARVIVRTPAGGRVSHPKPDQMAIDAVMVDYLVNQRQRYAEGFEQGLPVGATAEGAALAGGDAYEGAKFIRLGGQASLTLPLSTKGLVRLEISYARRFNQVPEMKGDFVCEFYDGQGWHQLEHKVGTERARGVTWKRNYLDVPATGENNADFKLRFRVDYAQGHAGVDDVVVRGVALR